MTKQEYLTAAAKHYKQSQMWFALNTNLLDENELSAGLVLLDTALDLLVDAAWQMDDE